MGVRGTNPLLFGQKWDFSAGKAALGLGLLPAAHTGLNSLFRGEQGITGAKNHRDLVQEAGIGSGSWIGVLHLCCTGVSGTGSVSPQPW